MLSKKYKKNVELFCREMMGDIFWDNLYCYQKVFLCCHPDMLQLTKRYMKWREKIKCLVANKD